MGWELTPFGASLALLGFALCSLAVGALRGPRNQGSPSTMVAAGLLGTVGVLVGIVGFQALRGDIGTSIVLTKLFVAVLALVPLLWLRYVCLYASRPEWFSGRVLGVTALVGVALVLAAATNEAHWLFWQSVGPVEGPLSTVSITAGPLFTAYLLYLAAPLLVALVLLSAVTVSGRGIVRAQAYALVGVTLAPAISAGAYLTGRSGGAAFGLVALATLVAAVGVMVGLVRYRWLEVAPVSRDRVVDVMTDATVVVSDGGDVVDHNPRAAALLCGDPDADFVGRPLVELSPRLVTDVLETDGRVVETALPTAEGTRRFEVTSSPTGAGGGAVLLLHDVTERAAMAADLASRRGTMEQLVSIARDLSAVESTSDVQDRATAAAVELLGADHCRIVGGPEWKTLATTAETTPFTDVLSTAIAGRVVEAGRPHLIEDLTIRGGSMASTAGAAVETSSDSVSEPHSPPSPSGPDGPNGAVAEDQSSPAVDGGSDDPVLEETFASLVSVPIEGVGVIQAFSRRTEAFDDDDAKTLSLLAAHVATAVDRRETERELRAERDRLEEFASVLSHDLRNPLSVATGYLELAREDPDPEHFDRIERAHGRMDDLVDDLLRLARDGELIGEKTTIPLDDVVEDAWYHVETEGTTLRIDGDLGTVIGDETRLVELFENLFRNAAEHGAGVSGGDAEVVVPKVDGAESGASNSVASDDAGAVEAIDGAGAVEASDDAGAVEASDGDDVVVTITRDGDRFVVADNGPGISPDIRDRVFERGVSGSPTGTGFGLAIVRDITEAHGWSVAAEESESGGAAFVFTGVT